MSLDIQSYRRVNWNAITLMSVSFVASMYVHVYFFRIPERLNLFSHTGKEGLTTATISSRLQKSKRQTLWWDRVPIKGKADLISIAITSLFLCYEIWYGSREQNFSLYNFMTECWKMVSTLLPTNSEHIKPHIERFLEMMISYNSKLKTFYNKNYIEVK